MKRLAITALAGLLSGCSLFQPPPPPASCPSVSPVRDAGELTRFAGEGRDLTDVSFRARVADLSATCTYDDGAVESELRVVLTAQRGPGNREDRARFGYFVAIATTEATPRILAREAYEVEIPFEGNRTRLGKVEELVPRIPLATGESGADYRIYVGLLLTPDELAYNRGNR